MKSPILSTFDSVTEAPSTTSALYKLDEENLLETSQRQPSSNNVNDLYYVPSWAEERTTRLCWLFRAHQLGNMYVLHEVVKNSGTRRRLILGPQWQLLMILYVTLAVGTIVIYGCVVPNTRTMQIAVGVGLSSITLVTLTVVALKDPGIVPRHTVPKGQAWTFCDVVILSARHILSTVADVMSALKSMITIVLGAANALGDSISNGFEYSY
eukprot:CAMPEP_0117776626 /NCGR_PEP_ID=MMETSP0947-20121206/27857_1 /TAXON_ID=44440 /ORGANISM="Chattonella subsalsa, Strain CCMP2191" /LENGTH=210 /DNA_ID=CAMNT_0005603583 /DNA_START=362 /DNA_END=995 /DNA_ORIENTATION=-